MGFADPHKHASLPLMSPFQIWSFWVKSHERNYRRSAEKSDLSPPSFKVSQGHWELTRIDRLPMTSYWWSVGLSRTVFRDRRRFQSKIANFSIPVCLTPPPAERVVLEIIFVTAVAFEKKPQSCPYYTVVRVWR